MKKDHWWIFCLDVMCQDAVSSPPRNYSKDQIKLPPGWIYPIFCLQHPPPARSPDSLSVCTAINELPGWALATLGLCEGLRSKCGLISNKYWFVCKWNSSIYGMVLDTQVVTKLPWGQTLSRMLISHLYERQQSRGSEDSAESSTWTIVRRVKDRSMQFIAVQGPGLALF